MNARGAPGIACVCLLVLGCSNGGRKNDTTTVTYKDSVAQPPLAEGRPEARHSDHLLELILKPPATTALVGQPTVLPLHIRNVSSASVNLPWPMFIDQFITSELRAPDGGVEKVNHDQGLALAAR